MLATSRPSRRIGVFAAAALILVGCSTSRDAPAPPDPSPSTTTGSHPDIVPPPSGVETPEAEESGMNTIVLSVGERDIVAELLDNPSADDLLAQLPVTLTFRDFNAVEKISRLPTPLTMEGVPAGDDPQVNDLGYYDPSGDLVLYYGDVGYHHGIVRLGTFEPDDMAFLEEQTDGFDVSIRAGA